MVPLSAAGGGGYNESGISVPPLDESIRQEVNHKLTNHRMNHFLEKVNHTQTYSMNWDILDCVTLLPSAWTILSRDSKINVNYLQSQY